ncbi:hypothetical protein [Riemerella columbina]|uniref:hypothetical protein n=1 Tax=Riemerella columbina TaxID=103810 RepID=UPI00037E4E0D|nr:hypothetical protein [Riemerella columbina]
MKKLFFMATLLVAGVMSAESSVIEKSSRLEFSSLVMADLKVQGGWCEVKVYRNNVLVAYSYTYESSQSACESKARNMMAKVAFDEAR